MSSRKFAWWGKGGETQLTLTQLPLPPGADAATAAAAATQGSALPGGEVLSCALTPKMGYVPTSLQRSSF